MTKWYKQSMRRLSSRLFPFLVATLGKGLIRALLWTCQYQIKGLETFKALAAKERCILMLWHNRLAITPSILYQYAPDFIYAALVSNSRDGQLISAVIHSYEAGRTIRVSHNARHKALQDLIKYLKEKKEVVIITPDGPRGPCYQVKPGIALAALETSAYVIPLTWKASRYWELKTWDKLKIPKPFAKIDIAFESPIHLASQGNIDLKQAQDILKKALPQD